MSAEVEGLRCHYRFQTVVTNRIKSKKITGHWWTSLFACRQSYQNIFLNNFLRETRSDLNSFNEGFSIGYRSKKISRFKFFYVNNFQRICYWGHFHQHFINSFYASISQKHKKYTNNLIEFLCFWNLRMHKLCINMLVKSTPGFHFYHVCNDY